MREQLQTAAQSPQAIQAEDIASMAMTMIGQTAPLDDKSSALFEQLVKQVFAEKNEQEE